MKNKKLTLDTIRVKSFTAILPDGEQRTAKGGAAMIDDRIHGSKGSWTEVKSGKESVSSLPQIIISKDGYSLLRR